MQSQAERLALLPPSEQADVLASLTPEQAERLLWDWRGFNARPDQIAPDGDWEIWLALAGRGWGKTETGAQWVRERVEAGARSIALVAETQKDLEEVMVARLVSIYPSGEAPKVRFKPVRVTWPNGAVALGYNGTEPNQLRGPEFDTAWVDELCLVGGTMVETEFGPKAIESVATGERVWTRKGLRRVNAAWMTSASAEVWEAKTEGGNRIVGTGNHPVWTREHGFIPLRALPIGVTVCAWKSNAQNGAGKSGISTAITSAIAKASSCTGSFINRFMAQSVLNSTFTTLMATRQTTPLKTSSQSGGGNTFASTARAASSFGIQSNGGKILRRVFGQSVGLSKRFASVVAALLRQSGCAPSIAAITASLKPSAPTTPDTTRDAIVSVALLPDRAAVFNIEVDGEPEYFANGILTHNCKYRYARETWDMLQFALRGTAIEPRQIVTTTPRPIELIKAIVAGQEGRVHVTRGRTQDNRANLAASFLDRIEKRYAGTRLGRQELDAEILGDLPGALWSMASLDAYRLRDRPQCSRIVVSVDPAVTNTEASDEHGIIIAGIEGQRGVVLEDASMGGSPAEWARRAVSLYRSYQADGIVVEVNQGGDMVAHTIRTVDPSANIIEVRASRGKHVRAEPIAALYEQGKIAHVGAFPLLEGQMTQMTTDGFQGDGSPDRVDALVWAFTELFPDMVERVPDVSRFKIPTRRGWMS